MLFFFSTLSLNEKFHKALKEHAFRVREAVFQREQGVHWAHDRDLLDARAIHFVVYVLEENVQQLTPVGAARAVEYEGGYKIGRVCVLPDWRRDGLNIGTQLMEFVIAQLREHAPNCPLYLNAQADDAIDQNVVPFYEKLGFGCSGETFDIIGIRHQAMTLA